VCSSRVTLPILLPYSFTGNAASDSVLATRRQWTRREIAGTLLVTRRVSRRGSPPSPAVRACSSRGPTVSVSLTNHKWKASKHVQETHGRSGDSDTGVLGGHIPSRARINPSGKGSRGPISRENEAGRPRRHQGPLRSAVELQSRTGPLVHRAMRGAHRRRRRLHSCLCCGESDAGARRSRP
jgi:hypothetical protein